MPPNSRPLSSVPGNYDHPPPTSETNDSDTSELATQTLDTIAHATTSLHNLRDILAQERMHPSSPRHSPRQADIRPRSSLSLSHMSSPASNSRHRMREALRRFQENDEEQAHYANALNDSSTPSSMGPPRARPRARPSERFLELHRQRLHRLGQINSLNRLPTNTDGSIAETNHNFTELQRAGEQLAEVNESLRNLLDRPLGHDLLDTLDREVASQEPENRRKRRRIEAPMAAEEYPRIEYGYHGQVKAGRLKMHVVTADGSITSAVNDPYSSRVGQGMADNVLIDDPTTYNSKSPRCNIVLSHQGETNFTLDKLVIKAPKRIMGDCIQEGLVFASLRRDAAFDRTAKYPIFYYPGSHLAPRSNRGHLSQDRSTRRSGYASNADEDQRDSRISLDDSRGGDADYSDTSNENATNTTHSLFHTRPHTIGHSPSSSSPTSDSEDIPLDPSSSRRSYLRRMQAFTLDHEHFSNSAQQERARPENDYDQMLAQSDLDEVLRRGASTTADRRDRARRRAHQRQQAWTQNSTPPPPPPPLARAQPLLDETRPWPTSATGPTEQDTDVERQRRRARESLEGLPADPSPSQPALTSHPADTNNTNENRSFSPMPPSDIDQTYLHPIARFTLRRPRKPFLPPALRAALRQDPSDPDDGAGGPPRIPSSQRRALSLSSELENSHRVSIKFEPPVSARFLLLKLWCRDDRPGCGPGRRLNQREQEVEGHQMLSAREEERLREREQGIESDEDELAYTGWPRGPRVIDSNGGGEERNGSVAGRRHIIREPPIWAQRARFETETEEGGGGHHGGTGSTGGSHGGERDEFGAGSATGTVELQSVRVEGWAGVRWFPAVEMR